jgi:hypothetical protein
MTEWKSIESEKTVKDDQVKLLLIELGNERDKNKRLQSEVSSNPSFRNHILSYFTIFHRL